MRYRLARLPAPFSMGVLGQQDSSWPQRAQVAIAAYDALMSRAITITDPSVRADILSWVGASTTPGTPADRYQFVKDDLASGSSATQTQHVTDLEAVNTEFSARVQKGEQSGTNTSASPLSLVTPQGQLSSTGIGLVVGAAACLLIVPLFVLK